MNRALTKFAQNARRPTGARIAAVQSIDGYMRTRTAGIHLDIYAFLRQHIVKT